jgi:type II secretory pathway pseudopilin PulG
MTIIEILIAVVVVAILSTASAAIYSRYVQGARASDARATISVILDGIKRFRFDNGMDPGTVDELEVGSYINLDDGVKERWSFSLIGSPVIEIQAISTAQMSGGAGRLVTYDVTRNEFTGYGLPEEDDN